jgi:hypothetical protein
MLVCRWLRAKEWVRFLYAKMGLMMWPHGEWFEAIRRPSRTRSQRAQGEDNQAKGSAQAKSREAMRAGNRKQPRANTTRQARMMTTTVHACPP